MEYRKKEKLIFYFGGKTQKFSFGKILVVVVRPQIMNYGARVCCSVVGLGTETPTSWKIRLNQRMKS